MFSPIGETLSSKCVLTRERDAARIAEEIVQHLTGLAGSKVEIAIEIQTDLDEGAGDNLVRDATENCRTLKFTDFGFEEDEI